MSDDHDEPPSDQATLLFLVILLALGNVAQAAALFLVYHPLG